VALRLREISDPRVKAWRAVVGLLTADPYIRTFDPLWQIPDPRLPQTPSRVAYDDPPPENRLTIRLTPRLDRMQRVAFLGHGRSLYEAPVRLGVEVTMPGGSDAVASQDVWAAIETALTDRGEQDEAIREHWQRLAEAGLFDMELETPGDSPDDGGTGAGVVVITCHVEG
jgi:hypothetical protein